MATRRTLLFALCVTVAQFSAEVAGQACGSEAGGCGILSYCENITVSGEYQFSCVCEPGTIGDSDFTSNDPPFTSGACNADAFSVRYVTTVPDLSDNPVISYTASEGFALCEAGAKGYYLRKVQTKLEVNCLYPTRAEAEDEESLYTDASIEVGPGVYAWSLGTTSQPLRIPPTGLTVDSVHFNTNCANSGCWVIKGVMTTGEAFNSFEVFNTFFLPQTETPNSGVLSYDFDYSAVDWTFQPANHPCTSADYTPGDGIFRVSYCCIDQPDVGPSGGFVANYRPTQNFVDWEQGFVCDSRFVSVDGTTKCWKYMGDVVDTWQQADARCRVAGGFLPSIANEEENNLFRDLVTARGLGRTWLGAWDRQDEGNFSWSDGSAGPGTQGDAWYDNWNGNNPNEGGPAPFREDCAEMYISRNLLWGNGWGSVPSNVVAGQWNDKECAQYRFNYFCQFSGEAPGGCLDHVIQRPQHSAPEPAAVSRAPCYHVETTPRNYADAEVACEGLGGHLATVFSPEDFHLMRRVLEARSVSRAWIGLDDTESEGTFRWVNTSVEFDVSPPYPFMGWKVGYPRSFQASRGDSTDCVTVEDGGYWWFDRSCTSSYASVCELPRGEDGVQCASDAIENEDPLWDVAFPVGYEAFMLGKFKDMPASDGVVAFDNLDPFFGQYSFEIHLDEVELRSKASQVRGTVGVEHTLDTYLGLSNFRPTGSAVLDTFSTQAALHLEKTSFFSVSTHGTNEYTFLEYVNLRLVQVMQEEDVGGFGGAGDALVRTAAADNIGFVQVTFTLADKFGVNDEPNDDMFASGLIPLDSVRAGRGTFFSTVEAEGGLEHVCQEFAQAGGGDEVGLAVGRVSKEVFNATMAQSCGPQASMCASPSAIPDNFVVFNVPLGSEVFTGAASDTLDSQIFVDMVINAIDLDARARDTDPNGGEAPWQAKTTLSASIPIVDGGVNIFCDGITARTDLKDVAKADIVVGTASSITELSRLRILTDVASSALDAVPRSEIDTASIESALMTLVLKGNATYFTSAGAQNTGGYSLELDDVITIHLMEDGDAGTVDGEGVATNSLETELIALLAQAPDDNTDSNGLDTDGYALNGAFRLDVDRGAGIARLNPTDALLAICPFRPARPTSVPLETCISRRDVRERGFPVTAGAASPTAMEVLPQTGLLVSDDVEDELLALDAQRVSGADEGCTCDAAACCEGAFMQSVLGESDFARDLAVDFARAVHERYALNGRWTRAYWINPGYEWTPTQTGGRAVFSVSQRLYLFALITLDENISRRRMLLAADADPTQGSGSATGVASLLFPVSQKSLMANAYSVPEDKVAVFAVEMQLTSAEACLGNTELQSAIHATLNDYLSTTASPFHTAQVVGLTRDIGDEVCARRRLQHPRALLSSSSFSSASASVRMLIVYKEEAQAMFNPAAFEQLPGILSVEPDASNVDVMLGPAPNTQGDDEDGDDDSGLSWQRLVLIAACSGVAGLVLFVAGACVYTRSRPPSPHPQSAVMCKLPHETQTRKHDVHADMVVKDDDNDNNKEEEEEEMVGGDSKLLPAHPAAGKSIRFAEHPPRAEPAPALTSDMTRPGAAASDQVEDGSHWQHPAVESPTAAHGSLVLAHQVAAGRFADYPDMSTAGDADAGKRRPPALTGTVAPLAGPATSDLDLNRLPRPVAHYDCTHVFTAPAAAALPPLPRPVAHYDCTRQEEAGARGKTEEEDNPVVEVVVNLWNSILSPGGGR